MATTPTLLSIDEYLHTSCKPDVDFVDGEIEERNLGEFDHARLQFKLASFFGFREKLWNVQASSSSASASAAVGFASSTLPFFVPNTDIKLDLTEPFAALD